MQWPWDPLQILSWLYFGYQVTVMYKVVVHDVFLSFDNGSLFPGVSESAYVIYTLATLGILVSGVIITVSDPTDTMLLKTPKCDR